MSIFNPSRSFFCDIFSPQRILLPLSELLIKCKDIFSLAIDALYQYDIYQMIDIINVGDKSNIFIMFIIIADIPRFTPFSTEKKDNIPDNPDIKYPPGIKIPIIANTRAVIPNAIFFLLRGIE